MPGLEPSESASPQAGVAEQIVIGFDEKLAQHGMAAARETIDATLARLGDLPATVLKSFIAESSDKDAFFALAVIRPKDPTLTLAELQARLTNEFAAITWVERNAPIAMAGFDDPLLGQQWALARLGATGPWTVTPPPTAGRTLIAIVDSGLRRLDGSLHDDLGSVAPVADCQLPWFYPDNVDMDGHGTFLAGTIAAVPDNAKGIGSAIPGTWNISLLPVKFFSPSVPPNAADAAIAIAHAVDKGAKVINASWHVAPGDQHLQALRLALLFARAKHRLVVIAAGNDGTDNEIYPTWPANFGGDPLFKGVSVLTVLATDRYDSKASFSNYGRNTVDIAAPGLRILTTGRYLAGSPRYAEYSGTSPAAAFASAGAALVFALNPGWKPSDVIEHLTASADTIEGLKLACIGGKRLNLRRAVYGPLRITAPVEGATVKVGTPTDIAWTSEYLNPSFRKVRIELSLDDGATYGVLAGSVNNNGHRKWKPAAGLATPTARIRIRPTHGNFPAVSGRFTVS